MRLMRKHAAQLQKDGFYFLLPRAHKYVEQLIDEFFREADPGLRCWLLELLAPRDTRARCKGKPSPGFREGCFPPLLPSIESTLPPCVQQKGNPHDEATRRLSQTMTPPHGLQ
jgi:hypothetical protein